MMDDTNIRGTRVFSLVIWLFIASGCTPIQMQKETPRAIDGILNLTAWDFKSDGPLDLNGEWEFYWKRHVPPEAFVRQDAPLPTGYMSVPGIWNGYAVDGQTISGEGYATYRLQVLLGSRDERLSFKFLDVATAFAVYVNGHRLFAAGVPGHTPQTTVPHFHPQAVDFQPTSTRLDIVIWVANFYHGKGGVWEAIRLGLVDDIREGRETRMLLDIFLLGSIMIMGLYHTGLFVLRKSERSSIYFSIFCFLIAARVLVTGERYLVQLIPNFDWEILVKISYLTFYLSISIFSMFVKSLFPQEVSKYFIYIINIIALSFCGIVLLTPAKIYSHTITTFQAFAVLTFVYGIYVLIRAVIRKREGALIFLIGFMVIVATTLNDILYSHLLIHTGYLIQAGLFIFICLQAFLLSLRFSKAFAVVEDQRQALSMTNRAYAQEIRDRQRAEEALAEAQRIAHIGNWEWDMQTGAFHVSNEVARMLGLSNRDTTYDRVTSMLHSNDRTAWEGAVRTALDEDTPLHLDVRMISLAEATHWIHSEARSIRNADRTPIKMFGTFQDITERKQMEENLLRASKLESIGLLAGGLAHDFNNILTAIVGNISLAKAVSEQEGKDTQLLGEAERAAMRATALTRQLLTFSKGGAPIKQLTAIAEFLRESVIFVLRGSNVRGEFSIPDDLWPAEVDSGQVEQVIHNLILNGIQAMPGGGVISISAENVVLDTTTALPLRPGPYLKIAVQDYGTGIREELLPKIFDPYFTTKPNGNGLGLAMAYSIIAKHDGHITVATQLGVGTTFHVYLPAATQDRPVEQDEARHLIMGTGKVLVMDDEETIRKLTTQMLHRFGYEVEVTQDGAEAVACYQQAFGAGERFDAVILDLTVPGGMGGRETLQRLLAIDPYVKAIVCSGYSNDPVMSAFQEYGFSYMLAKPYTLTELSRALDLVIAVRRRQTSEDA